LSFRRARAVADPLDVDRHHFEAPRGEHSEKPERFYEIVREASYPQYSEAFQRKARPDFVNLFIEAAPSEPPYDAADDFAKSLEVGFSAIRERQAAGGPGWTPGQGGEP
jgi:hypothetical protein